MKFLKNNLKLIIGILIGAILAGGIVYAAVSAREVTYTTDKNAEIKNVADALNDLYSKMNESFTGSFQLSGVKNGTGIISTAAAETSYCDINVNNYNKIKLNITSLDSAYATCYVLGNGENILDITDRTTYELNVSSYSKIRIYYHQDGGWMNCGGTYELSN